MLPQYTYWVRDPLDRLRLGWWSIYLIGGMIAVNLILVIINIIRSAIKKRKYATILKQKKKEFDKKQLTQKYIMSEI
jgi:hypothetical protein